jgi:HK97 family phage major capsid protein
VGTAWPVTLQFLDDPGPAAAMLDSRLRLDFALGLELDMLVGDGTGARFTGVLNAVGTGLVTKGDAGHVGEFRLDAIARAITVTHDAGWYVAPLAVVAHPDTLLAIRQEKDAGTRYVFNPALAEDIEAWVPSTSIPVGKAIVGDFFNGAALYLKEGAGVDTAREHMDFFARAMAEMMLWTRAYFWVRRPEAFTVVVGL